MAPATSGVLIVGGGVDPLYLTIGKETTSDHYEQ